MNIKQILKDFQQEFTPYIDIFIKNELQYSQDLTHNVDIELLITSIMNLSQKGKRIRPALLYWAYGMLGGKNDRRDVVFKLGVVLELIHLYLLIHDDVIDRDFLRRGCPTLQKVFYEKNKKKNLHFAESMATCGAIVLIFAIFEYFTTIDLPQDKKIQILRKISIQIKNTGYGEALDVLSTVNVFSEKDILLTHNLKTARYTFETPLHVGAILADNGDDNILQCLTKFAIPLGIAYQLQDDILGIFGTEQEIGKPMYSDLKDGKRTLLIVKALERATPKQKDIILRALGNTKYSKEFFCDVKNIIEKTGSLSYSKKIIKEKIHQALDILNDCDGQSPYKEYLIDLTKYIGTRNE